MVLCWFFQNSVVGKLYPGVLLQDNETEGMLDLIRLGNTGPFLSPDQT